MGEFALNQGLVQNEPWLALINLSAQLILAIVIVEKEME